MKKFKRIATFVLSMVMLFSFVVTHTFADDDDNTYIFEYVDFTESDSIVIEYFDRIPGYSDSYARVTGDTWTAQDCNINCRTYVKNYHPAGTDWHGLYTSVAAVYVFSEYDNGMTGSEYQYAKCLQTDDMVYAYATVGSSIDYEAENEYIESFASHHWLIEGLLRYDPENLDKYYQYENTETIVFRSDATYDTEENIPE